MSGPSEEAEAKAMPAGRPSGITREPAVCRLKSVYFMEWLQLDCTKCRQAIDARSPIAACFARSSELGKDRSRAMWTKSCSRNRVLAAGIAGLAVGLLVPSRNCDAQQSATILTCTNPVSGASWRVTIDFDKATVDSNRAKIPEPRFPGSIPRMAATTHSTANRATSSQVSHRAPEAIFAMVAAVRKRRGDTG